MTTLEVQPDTGEVTVLMSEDEARDITLKIKQYAGVLCSLVKEAHEKQAWRALGYATWAAYCKAEFNIGKSRSYQLVKYAEVIALGSDTSGLPESTIVDSLPEGRARGLDRAELADMLEDAYESLPEDATINTRRELFDAVLAQLTGDQGEPSDVDDKDDGSSSPSGPEETPATPPVQDPGKAGADTPSDAAATGCTDADIPASGAGSDGGEAVPPTAPPVATLPADWRTRLANAAYLLGCPADLLRDALDGDDRADLEALHAHLTLVLEQS